MMNKKIKTGKATKINPKSASPSPEQPQVAEPTPAGPREVDPNTFTFPINTTFEMNNRMHRVVRAYVNDNEEMREVASDGEITVLMLKTLRNDALRAQNFLVIG